MFFSCVSVAMASSACRASARDTMQLTRQTCARWDELAGAQLHQKHLFRAQVPRQNTSGARLEGRLPARLAAPCTRSAALHSRCARPAPRARRAQRRLLAPARRRATHEWRRVRVPLKPAAAAAVAHGPVASGPCQSALCQKHSRSGEHVPPASSRATPAPASLSPYRRSALLPQTTPFVLKHQATPIRNNVGPVRLPRLCTRHARWDPLDPPTPTHCALRPAAEAKIRAGASLRPPPRPTRARRRAVPAAAAP